ncbi:MAG: hypothetical protein U0V02_20910 [Anaerolineales bacterium]
METLGINSGLLFVQMIVLLVVFGLPIISLFDLRKKKLDGIALGIWVLVICIVPVIGSLAYWIIKPTSEIK